MSQLTLNLLGTNEILLDGKPIKGLYAHAAALLIYLVVEGKPSYAREALVDLLWPEGQPDVARHNLRQAIWCLRAIGGRGSATPFLKSDRHSVSLNRSADIWCDVHAFSYICREAGLYRGDALNGQSVNRLSSALDLYRGGFLVGVGIPNSASFENWVATERGRLHCQVIAALEQTCAYYERSAQCEAAVAMARKLVEIDPSEEKAQYRLVRLLAESGQKIAAIAQYQACENYLWENLGVTPSVETKKLLEDIQSQIEGGSSTVSRQVRRERRRMTILRCGLAVPVGDDPENVGRWRDALRNKAQAMATRFDASLHVVDAIDIELRFGYPHAFPGDTERALTVALMLRDWAKENFSQESFGAGLGIGIATGEVVLEEKENETSIVGEPVLMAARLRHQVLADEILLADSTFAVLRGRYRCQQVSIIERGVTRTAYRLQGSDYEQVQAICTLPLIGRQRELMVMLHGCDRAIAGSGRVVMISGESGIGKSHLVRSALDQISTRLSRVLQTRCLPTSQTSELEPVLRLLRTLCGLSSRTARAAQRRKLDAALRRFEFDERERNLIAAIVDLEEGSDNNAHLTPLARQQAMGLILRLLRTVAREPLLVVIEDIHDMDASSKELLERFLSEIDQLPILIVMTTRLISAAPWLNQRYVTHVPLDPLTETEARQLAQIVANGRMDAGLIDQIVYRSLRVPLFIEEMTKAVLEASGSADAVGALRLVPATLQDSLLARFDALQEAGQFARLAAVIGREFDLPSLSVLAHASVSQQSPMLMRLIDAHIVEPMDHQGMAYTFCHDLIHQFAYGSLLRSQRKELHAQLAVNLEERMAAGEPITPDIVASHYRNAELLEPAVRHYYLAALKSSARAAVVECAAHLQEGLATLDLMPSSQTRDALELQLRVSLGLPLLQGRASNAQLRQYYERVEALVETVEDLHVLIPALRKLSVFHLTRADFKHARPLVERYVQLTRNGADAFALTYAHTLEGLLLLFEGRPEQAQPLLEQSVAEGGSISCAPVIRFGSTDPVSVAQSGLALCCWARGEHGRARILLDEALARGRQVAHPVSLVWAGTFSLWVLSLQGDTEAALALSSEMLETCTNLGMEGWACWPRMIRARILAERTRDCNHLKILLHNRDKLNGKAVERAQPYPEVLAAECCLAFGEFDQGLTLVRHAIDMTNRAGGHLLMPELLRLEGELLFAHDSTQTQVALAKIRAAFDLAVDQSSPALQLRAALSLARMQKQTGVGDGACLLQRTLDSYRPDAISPDLKHAQALLS